MIILPVHVFGKPYYIIQRPENEQEQNDAGTHENQDGDQKAQKERYIRKKTSFLRRNLDHIKNIAIQ